MGIPPNRGHEAIREFVEGLHGPFVEIRFEVPRVFFVKPKPAGYWVVRAVTTYGKAIEVRGIAIFTFDREGKIRTLREYWEPADLLAQL